MAWLKVYSIKSKKEAKTYGIGLVSTLKKKAKKKKKKEKKLRNS